MGGNQTVRFRRVPSTKADTTYSPRRTLGRPSAQDEEAQKRPPPPEATGSLFGNGDGANVQSNSSLETGDASSLSAMKTAL
jgi:hypothetical protein